MKIHKIVLASIILVVFIVSACVIVFKPLYEVMLLKQMVARLNADSRVAEVMVADQRYNDSTGRYLTTIKFVEFVANKALKPRYFTFPDNLIQFQSLVIRFDDVYVEHADILRGKSAYFFWKIFSLDGKNTVEYDLGAMVLSSGFLAYGSKNPFENALFGRFWEYALNQSARRQVGVKNAQVEAPGTRFIPGLLYTLKIEHGGGIRIDSSPIPEILRGETVPR